MQTKYGSQQICYVTGLHLVETLESSPNHFKCEVNKAKRKKQSKRERKEKKKKAKCVPVHSFKVNLS